MGLTGPLVRIGRISGLLGVHGLGCGDPSESQDEDDWSRPIIVIEPLYDNLGISNVRNAKSL